MLSRALDHNNSQRCIVLFLTLNLVYRFPNTLRITKSTIRFSPLGYLRPVLVGRCARTWCARDCWQCPAMTSFPLSWNRRRVAARRKDWPRTCSGLMSAVNAQILFKNRATTRFICGGKSVVNGHGVPLFGSSRFLYGKVKHRFGHREDRAFLAHER